MGHVQYPDLKKSNVPLILWVGRGVRAGLKLTSLIHDTNDSITMQLFTHLYVRSNDNAESAAFHSHPTDMLTLACVHKD